MQPSDIRQVAHRPRVDPSGLAERWISGTHSTAPPTLPEITPVAIRSLVKSGERSVSEVSGAGINILATKPSSALNRRG
jgi:hypothetical protein